MKSFVIGLALLCAMAGCKKKDSESHAEKEGGHGDEHDEHEEREPGVVQLTPEQVTNANIGTAGVERRSQAGLIEATAQIEPAADGIARIGARLEGRVTTLKAGVGDNVIAGKLIAIVESSALGSAKADYLAALAMAKVTRETADREKTLFEKKISSERDWREAEAAAVKARAEKEAAENRLHAVGVSDAQLALLKVDGHYSSSMAIVSPISGVVVERQVTLGQVVTPSDTMFIVMNAQQVWILVDIYEQDLAQVSLEQLVEVRIPAYPGETFKGKVTNIGAMVEPKTRTIKLRVALDNPDGRLKPGMFANVTLAGTTGEARSTVVVPAAAVQRDGDAQLVFLPRGEREFVAVKVKVGRSFGDLTEILDGLKEGETIVTTGSFLIKSELKKSELGGGHEH
ncbi:MAG: efflux RND transporter periplasmic adaptor subunit [Deltaproteobacteria bacterium]|nr:efflux RND transporter periplasmic adaptor subunit [Deltaproteobacteria bacterium]